MIAVMASHDVPFNVRLVLKGDAYGLDDCIVHDGTPMVEFYDARHMQCGPRGQFVSRYYLHTLLPRLVAGDAGLMLDGGVPDWRIDAKALRFAVISLLERELRK